MKRLMVSAAHKSSGKTTISVGLAAAWRAAGTVVQPYKKGPDYIDPMWLSLAAGRDAANLDPYLMDDAALLQGFDGSLAGADLALVEGNHGLYDGLALDGSNSNAALAHRLELPVLLVVDCRGMTRGIAPLLLGYRAFDPALRFAGVVLNRVGGSRHESKLRAAIERYTDWTVCGAVAEDPRLAVVERHLGLMPCAEVDDAPEHVSAIGRIVGAQVDLDALLTRLPDTPCAQAAHRGGEPSVQGGVCQAVPTPRLRVGIARDRAFGFYYPDDLRALRDAGCELVPFDTLRDAALPEVDALFIGGGFPETCLAELEANVSLRHAIRSALDDGMPAYAECGGLMYLSRRIRWGGQTREMVGAIPADTQMHERPVGRGYVELEPTSAMPWALGHPVRAHEFHHSSLDNIDPGVRYAWKVRRGHGIDGRHDGLCVGNLMASYAHLRDAAGTGWATAFAGFARQCAGRREKARPSGRPHLARGSEGCRTDRLSGDTPCSI